MLQCFTEAKVIYYRGYRVQRSSNSLFWSIFGPRPNREDELALSRTSLDAMRWVDQQIEFFLTIKTNVKYCGLAPALTN
ncbi:MAG: hypothetical protein VX643_00470 [Chloroflexota bacterium]|nr:hypothetical protein [Chloroflexota bacterium]